MSFKFSKLDSINAITERTNIASFSKDKKKKKKVDKHWESVSMTNLRILLQLIQLVFNNGWGVEGSQESST